MTDHVTDSDNFPGDDELDFVEGRTDDELLSAVRDDHLWGPMRTDAGEIEYRFAQSTTRLRDLRARKQEIFDAIRDEVIANNRLARAARIYGIELEGDDGGDSNDT